MTGLQFGVLATVRLNGLNPYTWVLDYLGACARHRGEPPQELDPWLPWRMDEQRQQELRRPPVGWQLASAPLRPPPRSLPRPSHRQPSSRLEPSPSGPIALRPYQTCAPTLMLTSEIPRRA